MVSCQSSVAACHPSLVTRHLFLLRCPLSLVTGSTYWPNGKGNRRASVSLVMQAVGRHYAVNRELSLVTDSGNANIYAMTHFRE